MTEPLVKQIVDLKEEHTLMLEALKAVDKMYRGGMSEDYSYYSEEDAHIHTLVTTAIKAAEEGNERRKAVGNVDLPDRRGMK